MLKFIRVLWTPKMLVALLMGFSSGLPLMLATGSTLQAWMSDAKVDLKTIGLFSLVGLPYTLKFLWSPLFDRFPLPFLGKRRGWLLITQLALALSIAAIGFWKPGFSVSVLVVLALIASFFSASQDIVIDAYRAEEYNESELGLASSLYVNGYRFAMLFSGAFALMLADRMPWSAVYLIMSGTMLIGILTTLFCKEPIVQEKQIRTLKEAVIDPFVEYFKRNGAWTILAFILLYKVGDTMASALTTKLYLDVGFSKTEIGAIGKTFGLVATLAGAFFGGLLMVNLGIYRSLWIFGILQSVSTFGFSVLASMPPQIALLSGVIAFENFTGGMGTSAYAAYMATQTNKKFTATQYALLSSLMGVPRVVLASSSGYLVSMMGWSVYFIFCGLLAIPGLLILIKLRPKTDLVEVH